MVRSAQASHARGQDKELGITPLARSGFIKHLICIYEYAMLPSASTKHQAVRALTEMLPLGKMATLSCGEKFKLLSDSAPNLAYNAKRISYSFFWMNLAFFNAV